VQTRTALIKGVPITSDLTTLNSKNLVDGVSKLDLIASYAGTYQCKADATYNPIANGSQTLTQPTLSGPGWVSMLTGIWQDQQGVVTTGPYVMNPSTNGDGVSDILLQNSVSSEVYVWEIALTQQSPPSASLSSRQQNRS